MDQPEAFNRLVLEFLLNASPAEVRDAS
jgi:hypothetical protein